MSGLVLAVDGGGSKTDVALVGADGALRSFVRGPTSSPHKLGLEGSVEVLERLARRAVSQAGLDGAGGPFADVAEVLIAGADLPSEEEALRAALDRRGWAARTRVANDTFAVLRAGTEEGWGVAVVCGSGINCVGVGPDGRHARFLALGDITGDWGGGYDVGMAAQTAAARSEDGRGLKTALERHVPAYFGYTTPSELAEAVHRGDLSRRRLAELPPVVFAAAGDDLVAGGIVERLASEVVAFARAALERLELTSTPVEVLLGGGLLQSGDERLLAAIEDGLREVGPAIRVRQAGSPPIVGAALLALDAIGADTEAQERTRAELGAAVARLADEGEEARRSSDV